MLEELVKFTLAEVLVVGGSLLIVHLICGFRSSALKEKRKAVQIEKRHRAKQKRIAEAAERQLIVEKFNKIAAENKQLEGRLVWRKTQ